MFKCSQHSINILTARIVSHQADTDQTPFEGTKSTADLDAVLLEQQLTHGRIVHAVGNLHGIQREETLALWRQQRQADPGKPIDKDLYDLPAAEQKKIKQLPGDLGTVLDNLEKSHDWLLKGDVFTPDVIETWIEYKRKNELDPVRLRPHPWEFALYYDI